MLGPETILLLQGFAFGIAQNLIASAIVEGKKLKDDETAREKVTLLEQYEHSKPLEDRVAQAVCEAFRNLTLNQDEFRILLPLASDPIFGGELARQILADKYSPEDVATMVIRCSPSAESLGKQVIRLASLLVGAIQSAIADDPNLWRTKALQFQSQITAQVAEVKAETSKTQETVRQTGQVVIEALSPDIQQIHATLKSLSDKTSEPEIREKIYHDRVEQARKLLESGKPKTARGMLEDLRKEIAKLNASKSLLFRIATNIGSCAIQLDDQETAIREIDLAFQLDPENPKAITNLSGTTLLKGNPQKALELAERARQLTSQDSIATANYIQALFALGRESEVEQLIGRETWIAKDSNCCFVIGTLFFNRGRFSDAESFLRLGLAGDPTEPRLLVNLAHSLIRPVQNPLLGQPILNWKFPADSKPKLKEAESLLSQAIAAQEEFEGRSFFAFAHVLRADVRRMLGNEAAAISDCEIALHENPSDESALPIKALAHLQAGQLDEAIESFEKVRDADGKRRIVLPLATAYNGRKTPEKVVSLLTPYWEASPSQPDHIKISDQLLWAYSQLRDAAAADKVIDKLQTAWPKNPEALSAIASYRVQQGKVEEGIGLFTEALAYACGPVRDFVALQLADIFYGRDEFSRAVELYESAADLTTNNELSRRYLVCLYNSGPHKEALSLAIRLRDLGEPLPVVSQIEANILAEIGDLKTAQQIMERLSQLHPKIHAYRIAAAEFAMRRGRHANATTLLGQLIYEEIRTDANILTRAAQIRAVLGMGDVLKYLYQARRVGFNSPQIHAAYFSLFVSREQVDRVDLGKETVDGDCGVLLKIGNDGRAYSILSENDLHPERGEISPDQARTMQLLGRKKGDRFLFGRDPFGNEIVCTIVEVQSKYVRAFQETLEKFPTLFPTDRTLQGVEGPYEKLRDGMFRQLDNDQQAFRKLTGFYESKQVTFEALARVLHCSPFALWGYLIGGKYCPLANFSGTAEDAEAERVVASQADSIILELTAILTFAQIGLLDRLAKRYKLFTTQPVLDTLAEAHAEVAVAKPGLTIGKAGDTYIRQETTAEALAVRKGFLERIIEFLAEHVPTLAVPSLLEKDPDTDELRDFLGPISTASIFAARAENLPLYSEDQMLRALARNEWKIRGMSAQPVLHDLKIKGILTPLECTEAVAKLVLFNYRFISVNAEVFLWVLDKVQHRLTGDVQRMLAVFHGPECTFESAIEVLAEVTKRVWLESTLYDHKIDLVDGILDALGTNRPTNQVAEYFTRVIKLKLFLAPNAADAIAERVRLWKERKLGRAGIIIPPRYRAE